MRWEIAKTDNQAVQALMSDFGLPRPIALVLVSRGIAPEQLNSFLDPKLQDLIDPFVLPDMQKAVERMWLAIQRNERIVIHGDYDADGITSTVLLAWVLRENGAQIDCFLPHRMEDGYGLTSESVLKAVAEQHKLLITVDCGITSCEATDTANANGIDVIITDHHQPGDHIPKAFAVLNPKLHPELEELQCLAGVGVCFKLCHGFIKFGRERGLGGMHFDLKEGMDLVAMGTVADIVPLLGENRTLVRHGMKVLSAQRRPGIRALCDLVRLNDRISPEDVTYRLAPRLNAAGRLGDPEVALRLLQARSIVDAYPLADHLDDFNRQRQCHEERAFASAKRQVTRLCIDDRFTLVAKGENWHRGVIGIVASRLSHEYHRPTIVLSIDEKGDVHGSGRSIRGINLVDALRHCSSFLTRYGGHPMATGLALTLEHLQGFEDAFETAIRNFCNGQWDFTPCINIEGDVRFDELSEHFFLELERLGPFGHSNPAPLFRFHNVVPERIMPAGRDHTRGILADATGQRIQFIAFGRRPDSFPKSPWYVVAVPEINIFRGSRNPQLQVIDLRSMAE